jgi:RNA polymerase sigma factor (sigma-70 family)
VAWEGALCRGREWVGLCRARSLLFRVSDEHQSSEATSSESLFLAKLPAIDRAIQFTCWRASFDGADAEDFASWVKLKLIENDYAALTKFEHRCSFAAYISIIVQRYLLDYRVHLWGKWHASAAAKRLGELAVAVESLLIRDGLTVAEALPVLRRKWPELEEKSVHEIAAMLPNRFLRPRTVDLDMADNVANPSRVNETSFETDRADLAGAIGFAVREALDAYSEDDRLLLRLRFHSGTSIADIARMLAVEQKPLYRRLQRILADLRARLRRRNIDAEDIENVIGSGRIGVDFDLGEGSSRPCPSHREDVRIGNEDESS